MELQEARGQLMKLQEQMSAYDHAMGLISYDGDTVAPPGHGGEPRPRPGDPERDHLSAFHRQGNGGAAGIPG